MYDVVIVGCGPVGALLANLLGQANVSVLVLERDTEIHPLPRAVHFDGEVMRVFQATGLAQAVQSVARPTSSGMHFVNAQGETLMVRRGVEGPGLHDWANNWYFNQPALDAVLREGLARFSSVTLHVDCEAVALTPGPGSVQVDARDRSTGEICTYHGRYVVGCDGARSCMREAMATTQLDLGLHQPWLVLDLLCHEGSPRVEALPRHTVQHCNPARPRTRVYIDGHRHRFELMLMPGDSEAEIQQPENFWPLVSDLLQPEDAEVERVAVYTFHSLVAEQWRADRLFLAGDSCHQTPPFLGQGLCAGIRDAANLWWKLVRVIRGEASPELLDSYGTERIAHVREFIELAVSIGAVIQATDSDAPATRDAQLLSGAPQLFDFPQPQLGEGIHTSQSWPVASTFGQPRMPGGRLLDDITEHRFALIGTAPCLAAMDGRARAACEMCDVMVLDAPPVVLDWLRRQHAIAVLLRPDNYIFGLAEEMDELCALLETLPQQLKAMSPFASLFPGSRASQGLTS